MEGWKDGVPGTASSSVTEAVVAPSDKEPESLPLTESAVVAPYEDATEPLPQAEPTAAAAVPSEKEVVAYFEGSTLYDLDRNDFAMDDNYNMTFQVSPGLLEIYENGLADLLNSPTDEGVLINGTVNQELEADCNAHDIPDEIAIKTPCLNGHESEAFVEARRDGASPARIPVLTSSSSVADVIDFGGIPDVEAAGVRSSARLRAQPDRDDTQMARATCRAQGREELLASGYLQSYELDPSLGFPGPCAPAGTYGYWMQPAGDGISGYLQPGWLAVY